MQNNLDKITKLSIYLLVFLMPLFFLPWTSNVLDFNKQALLVFMVFLSLFCWLLQSLTKGKITLNMSKLNIPVIVFLAITGISTWFSAYQYGSFWGWPLNTGSSFLTLLCFVLVYFLVTNVFKKKDILGLLFWLVISASIAALLGGLQLFGKFLLPFSFSKINSFNTVGTVNSLGIFLGALLPLFLTLYFISRKLIKSLLGIFSLIVLAMLFVINFWVAWFVVLVGSIVILVFGISKRETFKASWLTLPMFFLVISVFFGVFRIGVPGLPATPLEISPSQTASFNIAKQSLKENPILGSGPGTFVYNYSKFKPQTINQTAFWSVRFSTGASDIIDKLATGGILGFVSFLAILILFSTVTLKKLIKREEDELEIKGAPKEGQFYDWILSLGLFASWLSIVGSMFLYPTNLCVGFIFWLLNACFLVLMEDKTKTWKLEPSSMAAISVSFLFILILIVGIGLFFMEGQRYLAEVRYQQGIAAWASGNNTEAVTYLLSANSHTGGKQDNYWRDLSQIYLLRAQEELQKEAPDEEIARIVTVLVSNAVNSSKAAVDAAPENVANWTVRGFVYRQVTSIIEGAGEWAITSYQKALELEPTNPYLYTEMGRTYLAKQEPDQAKEQFKKALDLKSDYAPARFQIALTYVEDDRISEAITEMEDAKALSPFDVGVAFQLGVLYYNNDQLTKAKVEFERAIGLNENYSNARYFLGLIHDVKGEKSEAMAQFEKIAELNPNNQEIQEILGNLRAGRKALAGIVTEAEVPIEEKPEEVLE